MVDDNAMALWHQSLWHGDKRDALVDDNDSMTRVMMTGWQAGHYGMVDDKMTTRSLWLMTITLWHKSWWQDDRRVTMVIDNNTMTRVMMTRWQADHYGWWQWLYDTLWQVTLVNDRMTSGSLWLMTMTAHGDKRQQSAASAGQRRHNTIRHHFYHSAAQTEPKYFFRTHQFIPTCVFTIRFNSLATYMLKVFKDLV